MLKRTEYRFFNWNILKVLVMAFQQVNVSTIKKPKFAGKTTLPIVNQVNNSINTCSFFCVFTKLLNVILGEQETNSKTRNSPEKVLCEFNVIIL